MSDNWNIGPHDCGPHKNEKQDDIKRPLDRLVMWLRWPEDKGTGRVPWFVIAWRLPWFGLIYTGLSIAWIGVACGYGINRAAQFWHEAT